MKSERRHELQQNDLALWLTNKFGGVKPYVGMIGGGLVAVVMIWAAVTFFATQSSGEKEKAWNAYNAALWKPQPSRNDFKQILDDYPESDVALAAQQRLATMQKNSALDLLLSQPETAKKRLQDAAGNFSAVMTNSKHPLAQQYCAYELARTYESLLELDVAKERYKEVFKRWPKCAYADAATRRYEDLNDPRTDRFYAWYRSAKLDLVPSGTGLGLDSPAASQSGESDFLKNFGSIDDIIPADASPSEDKSGTPK